MNRVLPVARCQDGAMAEVRVVHTAGLNTEELRLIRVMLNDVFDDLTEHDYEHVLGGMHALVWEGSELVAHGSVIMRRLLHGGRSLRTGYVEGVAVRVDRRRRGHGATVMTELERIIYRAYEIGALGAADEAAGFYAARGWQRWPGTASVMTPNGLERTPDDEDCIYVLPVHPEQIMHGDLACDWRDGDVW
jgi:aminoglycoside 2'-N-acetyltransferase I